MPETAFLGFAVQVRAAPAVPVPPVIASVTLLVSPVTVFPAASCTVTAGCVANAVPPVEALGCVLKLSFVAAPATTLKISVFELVAPAVSVALA